jgi:hypothetical protein
LCGSTAFFYELMNSAGEMPARLFFWNYSLFEPGINFLCYTT